jgi:hypothetical protein
MSARKILSSLFEYTGFKKYFISHLLYNKIIRSIFDVINSYRWREIDLAIILWPPAHELFDDIQKDIGLKYEIKSALDFKIRRNMFSEFVNKLYEIDYASPNKINMKIVPLQREPMFMRYLIVRIPKPNMSCEDVLNRVKCRDVNKLKMDIRKKYRDSISDYIYDLIIHSTEVDYQNKEVLALIDMYNEEINYA